VILYFKKRFWKFLISLFLSVSLAFLLFNYNAYLIESFNASVRIFIKTGGWSVREFDQSGLPVSNSPRIGTFISPFYVVHYGLIYSEGLGVEGLHWRSDPSIQYWNVHPEEDEDTVRIEKFKSTAEWLVDNVEYYNGHAHLMYHFDWPYKNYPNSMLKAPWWSGLTDGYAIILLLRAHSYFGDDKYLSYAEKLYRSVLSDTDQGGSLSQLNGCPWIEEYVDPRVNSSDMSFVLNGMVYATYGVEAFERYTDPALPVVASDLYECIDNNIAVFNNNGWSYYDAIGNSANIKYHGVNYAILKDMLRRGVIGSEIAFALSESWGVTLKNSGFYYILLGPKSIAYYHFTLSFFTVLAVLFFFILWLVRLKR